MPAVQGMINGNTGFLRQFAGQLDPAGAAAARTAAEQVRGSVHNCGLPLPGCQAYNAAVIATTSQIAAFCAQIEQGIQAYGAIAAGSAADYLAADGAGRSAIERAVR